MANNTICFGWDYLNGLFYYDGSQIYEKPSKDVVFYQVPGRNGDLSVSRNRFNNLELKLNCYAYNMEYFNTIVNVLTSYTGYQYLQLGSNPSHYRYAQFVNAIVPETTQLNRSGTFMLVFNCKPQNYIRIGNRDEADEGLLYVQGTTEKSITDFGNFTFTDYRSLRQTQEPVIGVSLGAYCTGVRIRATTDVTLNPKYSTFTFTDPNHEYSKIYIDCTNERVYDDNGNDIPATYWSGEFPKFTMDRITFKNIGDSTATSYIDMSVKWWEL